MTMFRSQRTAREGSEGEEWEGEGGGRKRERDGGSRKADIRLVS